jgi:predicted acyltransferase
LRGLAAIFAAILVSYWALLTFVPPPDQPAPTFEIGKTWPNYIDIHYLPEGNGGRQGWSNEGYLSTVPAVATCLLGVFVGTMLKNRSIPDNQRVAWLLVGGVVMVTLGYLWGIQFPVIKRIWTSSYVLVAGGYSCLLLGLFYLLIDIRGYRNWATPFIWIGSNAITAYLICGAFPWGWALRPLESRLEPRLGEHVYGVIHWSIITVAVLVVINALYRRKWFLRL